MSAPTDAGQDAYAADSSLKGKLRRRYARLVHRRPARMLLDRPMVSFSFDDAPSSAVQAGAALLEARGLKGTYFISMGLAGKTGPMGRIAGVKELEHLVPAGHEIGCHTHSHLDCGQATAVEIEADVLRNKAALTGFGAPAPATFAYPYGDVSPIAKQSLGGRFALLRGLHHGLIRDGVDLNQAPAVGIEGPEGELVASRWLRRALNEPAWLILSTHAVADEPSAWGCTPGALSRLIDRALKGGADVVTVEDGCRRIGAPHFAKAA